MDKQVKVQIPSRLYVTLVNTVISVLFIFIYLFLYSVYHWQYIMYMFLTVSLGKP
jgi:ABC-type multidrug transport system permease subunit